MSTRTEMATCECGREHEDEAQLELKDCDVCGEKCCSDCRHVCASPDCDVMGCEKCMVKTPSQSGQCMFPLWFCSAECLNDEIDPYGLLRHANEARKNMRAALEQYLPLVEPCDAVTRIRNAAKLYLTVEGGS